MKKALANMKHMLELEQIELDFFIITYDSADKDLVIAKRKAEIALQEFRVKELAIKIDAKQTK